MLCLSAWLGALPTRHVNQLMVYSKLGGNFLGFVDKPCMPNQAVTSCKSAHPNLGIVEVSIKQFAAKKLPNVHGFSWQSVNVELEGSRAFVMWDANLALKLVQKEHKLRGSERAFICVNKKIVPEIQVLNNDTRMQRGGLHVQGKQDHCVDLDRLACLTKLTILELERVNFHASKLPSLNDLSVTSCEIQRLVLPPGLRRLSLHKVALQKSASLASLVTNHKSLTRLAVHNQAFESNIPSELGSLSVLVILKLVSTNMVGHIPTELGLLSRLVLFNASYNKLSGPIPTELGGITTLHTLLLHENRLTVVPKELAYLQRLDVRCNKLGAIPTELQRVPLLRT